eukprot:4629513-Pyramimonas_sp.AAC.1
MGTSACARRPPPVCRPWTMRTSPDAIGRRCRVTCRRDGDATCGYSVSVNSVSVKRANVYFGTTVKSVTLTANSSATVTIGTRVLYPPSQWGPGIPLPGSDRMPPSRPPEARTGALQAALAAAGAAAVTSATMLECNPTNPPPLGMAFPIMGRDPFDGVGHGLGQVITAPTAVAKLEDGEALTDVSRVRTRHGARG